jgi:hypothetical protein
MTTAPTGHQRNVANFEELIASCVGFGAAFNPSNASLKIAQLQTLQTTGKNVLQTVKTTKTAYDNACNAREIAMAPLKKLCTRIVNALEATTATKQTVNDVRTINRKIQGQTLKKQTTAAGDVSASEPKQKTVSTTQQSFDSMVDNFQMLLVAISSEPVYAPNEAELKVTALNALLTNIKTLNTASINAGIQYRNAIAARDASLYQPTTGLVDEALEVKKYVKSVFGSSSPQFKQISGLAFKKQRLN